MTYFARFGSGLCGVWVFLFVVVFCCLALLLLKAACGCLCLAFALCLCCCVGCAVVFAQITSFVVFSVTIWRLGSKCEEDLNGCAKKAVAALFEV